MDPAELQSLVRAKRGARALFFDTETTGCNPATLRLTTAVFYSVATGQFHYYLASDDPTEQRIEEIGVLMDCSSPLIVHNMNFDLWTVFAQYFSADRIGRWAKKTIDLFEVIRKQEGPGNGSWVGINHLCQVAGLQTKVADGVGAIDMWNEERYKALVYYCAVDVYMMMQLHARDEVYFCCKAFDTSVRKNVHVGVGRIDMATMRVYTKYGAGTAPPGMEPGHCPCFTVDQK